MNYYKVTGLNGEPLHGGTGDWPLPKRGRPGRWRKVKGVLEACSNGLHLVDHDSLAEWVPKRETGFIVWLAEARGEIFKERNKYVAREARLLREVARVDEDEAEFWAASHHPGDLTGLRDFHIKMEEVRRTDPRFTKRITFGVHRLDPRERIAPAWPTAGEWEQRMRRQAIRNGRRALGLTEAMDRVIRANSAEALVAILPGIHVIAP